jgi:hypothetical protein
VRYYRDHTHPRSNAISITTSAQTTVLLTNSKKLKLSFRGTIKEHFIPTRKMHFDNDRLMPGIIDKQTLYRILSSTSRAKVTWNITLGHTTTIVLLR